MNTIGTKPKLHRASPRGVLRDARDAWFSGDFVRATDLLTGAEIARRDERVEAASLLARAALRAGRPAGAIVALDDADALLDGPDERVTAASLRGTALVRIGRTRDGIALLERAVADATAANRTVRAEAGYRLADAYVAAGRLDAAEAALDAHADMAAGIVLARALELYGWIEVRRERYPIAARHFLDALEVLRRSGQRDGPMMASLLHGMSSIALQTLDLKLFARVRGDVDALALSPDTQSCWFAIRRTRALVELLDGNAAEAWRLCDEAVLRSAPGSQRVDALVTAARVARAAGETFTPDRLVLKAAMIAADVDWSVETADVRGVLAAAVRDVAGADPPLGRRLLDLLEALPDTPAVAEALEGERHLDALANTARAAAARADGDATEAVIRLRAAAATWRAVGDRFDEALALLALAELLPDDDALRRVDELTRVIPRSWLRRRYMALSERARGVEQLSPAEHRVMLAICEGRSTADIANRFGRSKNTIRNQTRRVYEVMAVRTRSALVSKCASMGIVAGSG